MPYRRHRRTPSFHVKQGQLSEMPPQTPVTDHQWCCCRERQNYFQGTSEGASPGTPTLPSQTEAAKCTFKQSDHQQHPLHPHDCMGRKQHVQESHAVNGEHSYEDQTAMHPWTSWSLHSQTTKVTNSPYPIAMRELWSAQTKTHMGLQ